MNGIRGVAATAALLSAAALAGNAATEGSYAMNQLAAGAFDVKIAPLAETVHAGGTTLGRYSLDKTYHGELEGTSRGEMLTAGTGVAGSAGYVAIERVEGTLGGRAGSFVLQHVGRMSKSGQNLTISVLPDSGTAELAGLEGAMQIEIDGKRHLYRFEYSLPARP